MGLFFLFFFSYLECWRNQNTATEIEHGIENRCGLFQTLEFCEVCRMIYPCHAHVNHWNGSKNRQTETGDVQNQVHLLLIIRNIWGMFLTGVSSCYMAPIDAYLSLLGRHLGHMPLSGFRAGHRPHVQTSHLFHTDVHRWRFSYTRIHVSVLKICTWRIVWHTKTISRRPLEKLKPSSVRIGKKGKYSLAYLVFDALSIMKTTVLIIGEVFILWCVWSLSSGYTGALNPPMTRTTAKSIKAVKTGRKTQFVC